MRARGISSSWALERLFSWEISARPSVPEAWPFVTPEKSCSDVPQHCTAPKSRKFSFHRHDIFCHIIIDPCNWTNLGQSSQLQYLANNHFAFIQFPTAILVAWYGSKVQRYKSVGHKEKSTGEISFCERTKKKRVRFLSLDSWLLSQGELLHPLIPYFFVFLETFK